VSPETLLDRGLHELALQVNPHARNDLLAYLELLGKWNRTYNLTAIRDPLKMVTHHLLDSLAVLPHLPAGDLADVGSGGGLPGIPIAIAQPERRVVLNDSSEKKAAFLRQATIALGIKNAVVHCGRVETWWPKERFRVVISRGFAELADFVAACRHLVVPGGVLAAMKGLFPRQEASRVASGVECGDVIRLRVPFLDAERHLVLCHVVD
jgi:16S rRNA (guanine527-N7)-methyltransferase